MKTEFIDLIKKIDLQIRIKNNDEEAIKLIFLEIERLETIIRDYEIGLESAVNKLNNNLFKQPNLK